MPLIQRPAPVNRLLEALPERELRRFMFRPVASWGYRFCSWFENKHPGKAVRWWSYPIIQLTKKVHTL